MIRIHRNPPVGRLSPKPRAMAAAQRILLREGYARLTMERVAQQSGIAKTTLYRHWPTKAAICMDLYFNAARTLKDPDTGNLAHDLKQLARSVVRLQTRTVAGPALMGLIAEAQINPDTRDVNLAEFSKQRRKLTSRILRRALERGELQPRTDIDLVIDALGGCITFRLLQGHAPLNRHFTDQLVELVLGGCTTKSNVKKGRSRPR